jgi:hypothetical protein
MIQQVLDKMLFWMPNRYRVARMVSPLTCSWINPLSKLTSAASSQAHMLVGFPKLRGLLMYELFQPFCLFDGKSGLGSTMRPPRSTLECF